MSIICVRDVGLSLSNHAILQNISFDVEEQQFIGIAGLNGSGKTTLLKLLQRVLHPKTGSIQLHNRGLDTFRARELARHIAVVPQRMSYSFEFSARQLVLLGRTPYLGLLSQVSRRDEEIAAEAMEKTDCLQFASTSIMKLSAGELQRVCIATSLAQQSKIILLDEPATALDTRQQGRLLRLLKTLHEEGRTILCASHDLTFLRQVPDKVLLLHNGRQIGFGPPDEVFSREILRDIFEVEMEPAYAR